MDDSRVKEALDHIGSIFSQYGERSTPVDLLTPEEIAFVFERSDDIAARFGIRVSKKRWLIHFDMICHMVSRRYFKCKRSFIGACILNSITCFWDDIHDDDITVEQTDRVLKEIYDVCVEFYRPEAVETVYRGTKQWVLHDGFFRRHPLKRLLCRNDVSYWSYRMIDSGTQYSLVVTAPVYDNALFSQLVDINLLGQLANRPYMVVNDLCSHYKEKTFGEIANFLTYTQDVDRQIEGIAYDMKCIATLDPDVRTILMDKIFGHYTWARSTERYKNAITKDNDRLNIGSQNEETESSTLQYRHV